jgi:hypothetical protein
VIASTAADVERKPHRPRIPDPREWNDRFAVAPEGVPGVVNKYHRAIAGE